MHLEVGTRAICLLSPRNPGEGRVRVGTWFLVLTLPTPGALSFEFWLCWVAPPTGPVTNYIHSFCRGCQQCGLDRGTLGSKCRLSFLRSSQCWSTTPEFWSDTPPRCPATA